MLDFLFDTQGFPPRWNCGPAWAEEPWLGWTHIVADVVTFLAYLALPLLMLLALRRIKHAPEPRLVALFAVFILACGAVHLIEAIIFYTPIYRLSALAKVVTAGASTMTAIVFAGVLPKLLQYRSPDDLSEEVDRRVQELNQSATRLALASKQLEEEKERLALALEAGSMGTWDWDLTTCEVLLDEAEARLTELEGTPRDGGGLAVSIEEFYGGIHPDDVETVQNNVRRAIDRNKPFSIEFRMATRDGGWKWISGRGKVIHEEERAVRFVGVNYDITRQKRTEEQLAAARRGAEAASAAKSRFLANMSHEVRTPLTAILGCAESIARDAKDDDTAETADVIRRQGRLLLRVLSDVLDLSKIEAGKLAIKRQACRLQEVLDDVHGLMEPQVLDKGLRFECVLDEDTPEWVKTDPLRLRQVLLNLLSNCVKFTTEGSVRLHTRRETTDGGKPWLRFDAIDTGPGIPEAEQRRIFEAFHQAASGGETSAEGHSQNTGTGLGLTISSRLARILGGEIVLHSEAGVGSTFTLRLPLVEIDPPENQQPGADSLPAPKWTSDTKRQGSFLVAEDTPSVQFLLRRMLKPIATRLELVDNGEAAVAAALRAEADGQPFDLVLMDMHMPVLSGYDAAARLREAGFERPIIALTASAMVGDRERCVAAGCTAYVPKPIDWDALEYEVQTALAGGV